MKRTILAAILAVVMPGVVLNQTQRKEIPLTHTDRQLIALSRKAVANGVSDQIIVADSFTGNATVKGKFDSVELVNATLHIDGDRAVVTGRVVFKGGLPEWHRKESSSAVTIDFIKRDGQWKFTGLCLGDCGGEGVNNFV